MKCKMFQSTQKSVQQLVMLFFSSHMAIVPVEPAQRGTMNVNKLIPSIPVLRTKQQKGRATRAKTQIFIL